MFYFIELYLLQSILIITSIVEPRKGLERIKVDYPKFKNGEATVRGVRIAPNFGKYNGAIQMLFCYDSAQHCTDLKHRILQ